MKGIVSVIILVLFCACKKNYDCTCKTAAHSPGSVKIINSRAQSMDARYTKKQAKAVCDREATAIDETYKNFYTNNGNWSSGGLYTETSCTLK